MKYLPLLLALFIAAPLQAEPIALPKTTDPAMEVIYGGALSATDVKDLKATIDKNPGELAIRTKVVKDLEAALVEYPEDLSSRAKLLGHYQTWESVLPDARKARLRHVLWIIKNRPQAEVADLPACWINENLDPEGYRQAKPLWADQLRAHPKEAIILGHAARFLTLNDRTLAVEVLKRAKKLEPSNPKWPDQLGHVYALPDRKEYVAKALPEFEEAQALDSDEKSKSHRLASLATSAYTAGDIEKARYYAEHLLQVEPAHFNKWEYWHAVHRGNIVLGRIALKEKHIKLAGEYLLKAGKTPGDPVLSNFGPNMSLAKELLRAGQKKTVLQYFELCQEYWKAPHSELDLWTRQVKAGKTPNFGANLYY